MPTVVSLDEMLAMTGREVGPSDWLLLDQQRIDRFAEATGDRQFIHVDPERAARTPLGGTVAHGFLTLSLLPRLHEELAVVPDGAVMAFNYGLDKVRFLQPVRAGSRVRLRSKILGARRKNAANLLVSAEATIEIEGETRPAMVAETLTLYILGEGSR